MSIYYIYSEVNNKATKYTLDSTTSVDVVSKGTATSLPMEDGSTKSDHYSVESRTITFNGAISTAKSSDGSPFSPKEVMDGLRGIMESKLTVSVGWHGSSPAIDDCVIESLTFSQDNTRGYISSQVHAVGIEITMKELLISSGGKSKVIYVDESIEDKTDGTTNTSADSDGEAKDDEEIDGWLGTIVDLGTDLGGGQ